MIVKPLPSAVTVICLVLLASPGNAASFDCAKAASADEKAVCSDREMDDQDVEMSSSTTASSNSSPWGRVASWRPRRQRG